MTIQEFRDYMASGKPVVGGSDVHMMFHKLSQDALKITAEINGKYHTPEQLHDLLEQLWDRKVPFRHSIPTAARTRSWVNGYSSTWVASFRIRVASPSTRAHSSAITSYWLPSTTTFPLPSGRACRMLLSTLGRTSG